MLTTADIAKRYGVTRRTVTDRWAKRPDFPLPAKRINQRIVYWREEDIDAWTGSAAPEAPRPYEYQDIPIAELMAAAFEVDIAQKSAILEHFRACLYRAKKRANGGGAAFEIEHGEAAVLLRRQDFKCAVSGKPFSLKRIGTSKLPPFAPSIDRIDSSRGYELDNIRIVCMAVNFLMNEWGDAVFAELLRK